MIWCDSLDRLNILRTGAYKMIQEADCELHSMTCQLGSGDSTRTGCSKDI
jgi:hypothetical protein